MLLRLASTSEVSRDAIIIVSNTHSMYHLQAAINVESPQIGFKMEISDYKSISLKNSGDFSPSRPQPVSEVRLHLFSISSIPDIHSRNNLVRLQKLLEDKDKFTKK